jgi:hypothetical protein
LGREALKEKQSKKPFPVRTGQNERFGEVTPMANTFQAEKYKDYTLKIRALLPDLPMVCGSFFRSIESQTSVLTRFASDRSARLFSVHAHAGRSFPGAGRPSSPWSI